MKDKAKALFITHDTGNYGASRSLQQLLRNYDHHEIDLVVRKRINVKPLSDEEIREKFGSHIRRIHWLYLPFDYCCKYRTDYSLTFSLASQVVNLLWRLDRRRLMGIIREGNYEFIHLNSLVLHPIISSEYPFILHMRDIYDGSNDCVSENLGMARGVIFIDSATREPFRQNPPLHNITLNNPFDMTGVIRYENDPNLLPGSNLAELVIFSIIGTLTETKGTDFVIAAFRRLVAANVRLIIVGGGDKKYEDFCRKLADGDKRIIFWGEEADILKIYAMSDYVLRAEEYQCIGRTIYEGLYAGCQVIVPGDPINSELMFDYDNFKDSIHFYQPRVETELLALLTRLASVKISGRIYRSNIPEYIEAFHGFVQQCLGK